MRRIQDLLEIMARLRDPDIGCPWDVKQTFRSIAPYTIEEAYEVADAIERDDVEDLRDELGDLLLQVVFHARMAEEDGRFDFGGVVEAICDKMVRRHPHVFGDESRPSADAQLQAWEALKAEERQAKRRRRGETERPSSALDGVSVTLPGLPRAVKLQTRAARVGFDWPTPAGALDKLREELAEVEAEINAESPHERLEDEAGDLLFVCANLCRHLKVDPEAALRRANAKFARRFRRVETLLAERGSAMPGSDLATMEAAWDQAKSEEVEAVAGLVDDAPRGDNKSAG